MDIKMEGHGMKLTWVDRGYEPTCPPNPDYPDGRDLDLSEGKVCCYVVLPHPTPRCGLWHVKCQRCGFDVIITTAGRADDPRSVKLPCKRLDA